MQCSAGRHDAPYRHFVLRECPGFVGSNNIGRAERFHGRKAAHDRIAPGHALYTNRQYGGDDRGQPFGHRRNGERHAKDEHVDDLAQAFDLRHQQDGANHGYRDRDNGLAQQTTNAIELFLQRCGFRWGRVEHSCYAPHFGRHSRSGYHTNASPVRDRGTAECHVAPIAQGRMLRNRSGLLGDRLTLAA